jgi:hypothetical protein
MSFIANTAHVIAESFSSPNEESILYLDTGHVERKSKSLKIGVTPGVPPPRKPPAPLKPAFKWSLITVVAITVLSGLATIVIAGIWVHPTPDQQTTFEGFSFAWKAGIGAIFGLIGGKVT